MKQIISGIPALSHHPVSRNGYNKRMVRHETEPLPSCLDNVQARVTVALRRIDREGNAVIEGVSVVRTNNNAVPTYMINGSTKRIRFAAAVCEVVKIARERREREAAK